MAALQIFARSTISPILYACRTAETYNRSSLIAYQLMVQKRWSTYRSSPIYNEQIPCPDYDVSKDPNEWKYVERLLPYKVVPDAPIENKNYASGWKPATVTPEDHPYFVQRTKNHMQPLYLLRKCRGNQRVTCIRKIQGDIWALEADIREMLEKETQNTVATKIHEVTGCVKFRGDHMAAIKKWMDRKGF